MDEKSLQIQNNIDLNYIICLKVETHRLLIPTIVTGGEGWCWILYLLPLLRWWVGVEGMLLLLSKYRTYKQS